MVVDDDSALCKLLKITLKKTGAAVSAFGCPISALEEFTLAPTAFNLVISDKSMPGMTGFEMLRRMLALNPEVNAIMLSGYLESGDVERATEMGVGKVLHKPLNLNELKTQVSHLLS